MPTVSISGAQMFYRDEGEGSPLLLIHAFPLNSTMWQPQIAALSSSYRVIAPDLPGFGHSILGSGERSLDRYADSLMALLDELGIERVTVVGLSMGGYIVLALLRRHAQRLAGIVLADTKVVADSEQAKAKRAENAQVVTNQGQNALADRVLPTLLSADAPNELIEQVRTIIRENSRQGIATALHAMATRPDSSDLLAGISVPTTVVVGTADTLAPPDEARGFCTKIPGAELVEIEGAAHLSNLEAPDAFSAALNQLMQRVG